MVTEISPLVPVIYICDFDQLLYPTRFLNHQEQAAGECVFERSNTKVYMLLRAT
jgi:hypothetical protein